MRIQHNISALNSHRQLGNNNTAIGKNLEKLSSGYRVNRAGDDAAGLAISEKMRAQIKGLETAQKNAQDGISLVQTAEGALTEVHSMLNRMVELATQSANGTYDDKVDRNNLQKEVESLIGEIDRISQATNFNGINLLDGNLEKLSGKASVATSTADGTAIAADAVQFDVESEKDGVVVKFTTAVGTTASGATATAAWGSNDKTLTITLANKASNATTLTQADIDKAIAEASGTKAEEAGKSFKVTLKKDIEFGATATAAGIGIATAAATSGAKDESLKLQVGDTFDEFQKVSVGIGNMGAESLGIDKVSVATQEGAGEAINAIKNPINTVSSTRGDLGAIQNRLEHTINNLGVTTENMTAAESRIRDVDMAKEMMEFTKNNILSQAATSMLAQANQTPQGVLQLLN